MIMLRQKFINGHNRGGVEGSLSPTFSVQHIEWWRELDRKQLGLCLHYVQGNSSTPSDCQLLFTFCMKFTLITSFMFNHSKCGTFNRIPIRCHWASLDSSVWANSIRNKGICKRGSRNNTAQIWFSSQTDDVVHVLSRYSSVYSIVKIRIFFKV